MTPAAFAGSMLLGGAAMVGLGSLALVVASRLATALRRRRIGRRAHPRIIELDARAAPRPRRRAR